jgi:Fe-S-cluster containining protein
MLSNELTSIYTSYDRELQQWLDSYQGHISCRKGCSTCCNMSVGLYLPEAVVLAQSLTDDEYAAVSQHARRVFHYACETPQYLPEFRYSDIGWCPFLLVDEGACGIYTRRPANCRHVFSNMPPKYCDRETVRQLEQDAAMRAEFEQQLDPRVNEDGLPFMTPTEDIFHGKYELYLKVLAAKHFNVNLYGEMSWLLMLVREHDLVSMVTAPDADIDDFLRNLENTGWFHPNLLTECEQISPDLKEQSLYVNFIKIF